MLLASTVTVAYLAAGVLAPSEAGPDALYSAAVDRFPDGGGLGPEAFLVHMTNRCDALQAQYGESHVVAAMILAADDIGMTEWAQGFAQGVRILEAAWPTDLFIPEEHRMVSLLARLAEGELADLDACADVLTFIEWRWQARYGREAWPHLMVRSCVEVWDPSRPGPDRSGNHPDAPSRRGRNTVRTRPGTSAMFRSGVLGRVWGWQKIRTKNHY